MNGNGNPQPGVPVAGERPEAWDRPDGGVPFEKAFCI